MVFVLHAHDFWNYKILELRLIKHVFAFDVHHLVKHDLLLRARPELREWIISLLACFLMFKKKFITLFPLLMFFYPFQKVPWYVVSFLLVNSRVSPSFGLPTLVDFKSTLTLRSVLSSNNPQNSEMKFCENTKLTCWKSS